MLGRFEAYLFDMNLGFFSFAPLVLILALLLTIIMLRKKQWIAMFWIFSFLGTIMAYSLQMHFLSGMIYCSRYIIWTYPILAAFVGYYGPELMKKNAVKYVVYGCVLFSSFLIIGINAYNANRKPIGYMVLNDSLNICPRDYMYFNDCTTRILDTFPQLYNPNEFIFYSRTLHLDGAYVYWLSEPAYYVDSKDETSVRKIMFYANEESAQQVLDSVYGINSESQQYLEDKLAEFEMDNRFHYINIPRKSEYQFALLNTDVQVEN
jgi:hypothetical protein